VERSLVVAQVIYDVGIIVVSVYRSDEVLDR